MAYQTTTTTTTTAIMKQKKISSVMIIITITMDCCGEREREINCVWITKKEREKNCFLNGNGQTQ